jgi:pilus assembly protein CpaB
VNNRFRLNKTWVILAVALTIGGLAALAARSYLSTQMQAMEARGKTKTIQVIVASRELKRGDKINSDTVSVRAIPIDYAHSAAILPASFDRVEGQTLAYPVKPGEMILWGLMEGKKVPTFSARVETGYRAMTVAVDEINSISGLLEPGDIIDLLVTIDQNGKKVTRPLLQSVSVMATGQRVADGSRDDQRHHYSTVTVNLTPLQAKQMIMARDAGRITALLRNPEDRSPIVGGNADMVAWLNSATGAKTSGESTIPVLYGGNSKISPEDLVMIKRKKNNNGPAEYEDVPAYSAPKSVSYQPNVPVITSGGAH